MTVVELITLTRMSGGTSAPGNTTVSRADSVRKQSAAVRDRIAEIRTRADANAKLIGVIATALAGYLGVAKLSDIFPLQGSNVVAILVFFVALTAFIVGILVWIATLQEVGAPVSVTAVTPRAAEQAADTRESLKKFEGLPSRTKTALEKWKAAESAIQNRDQEKGKKKEEEERKKLQACEEAIRAAGAARWPPVEGELAMPGRAFFKKAETMWAAASETTPESAEKVTAAVATAAVTAWTKAEQQSRDAKWTEVNQALALTKSSCVNDELSGFTEHQAEIVAARYRRHALLNGTETLADLEYNIGQRRKGPAAAVEPSHWEPTDDLDVLAAELDLVLARAAADVVRERYARAFRDRRAYGAMAAAAAGYVSLALSTSFLVGASSGQVTRANDCAALVQAQLDAHLKPVDPVKGCGKGDETLVPGIAGAYERANATTAPPEDPK